MGVETVPLADRTISKVRRAALFTAPVAILAVAYGAGTFGYTQYIAPPPPPEVAAAEPDGATVYQWNCAYCHGPNGDGNGTAVLTPPARAFGREKYKLGRTLNGVPTDDDLGRVLTRGIPGSAMPTFDHLSDAERRAVVSHLRTLTRNGVVAGLAAKAEKDGDDPDFGEFSRKAVVLTEPGKPLPPPPAFPPPTVESLANGRAAFLKVCASCHGLHGQGDGPQVKELRNENGTPARPRDLTQGAFKGGREPEQVYARIVLGIPGTPMPSGGTLPPADVLDLVNYVLSLNPAAQAP